MLDPMCFALSLNWGNMVQHGSIQDQGRGFKDNFVGYLSLTYFILIIIIAFFSGRKRFKGK